MASDTTKKKTTAKKETEKTTKSAASKAKTTSTAKKATTKKKATGTSKKTTATKTATKKATTKPKNLETVKKETVTKATKKNKNGKATRNAKAVNEPKKAPKVEPKKINKEDLEAREADLEKTVVINSEIIKELQVDEDSVENLKIVESEKKTKNKKNEVIPKTILGIELPSNMTKEDRIERKKFYLKDALIFAIIVPILDLFAMMFIDSYTYIMITNSAPVNYLLTLLIDFILIFVVTYLIDFVFGEDAVKRINK